MGYARIVLLLLCAAASKSLPALEIEKLFMPGSLIAGHEEFEAECTSCHVRLRDTTQEALCRNCHEEIDEDMRGKRGFHGRNKQAYSLECKTCHSDHKGRDARIVWLDKDKFDHGFTDFRLEGEHARTECSACHLNGKKYRDARSRCYDCHSEDDFHKGELGKNCKQCHTASGWRKSEFDHDRTDFPLKNSHRKVSCEACHIDDKFKNTPDRCVDCHAIRDVHANRFGNDCGQCHSEKGWDASIFDHTRDTNYPLRGKHLESSCNDCHAVGYQKPRKKNTVRSCYSCHRNDDIHAGSNGKKCQDCHRETGWNKADFNHDTQTDFPLRGGHRGLRCATCHEPGAASKKIVSDCYSCHRADDAHREKLGTACNQCHNESAWQNRVRFDHDLSDFPLIGQHAALGCESCHVSSEFSDTGNKCIDCHRSDDVHERAFGVDCNDCHNPNGWLIWRFDHDKTGFRLRQSHSVVHCHVCHKKPRSSARGNTRQCIDCHRRDDIHGGKFGARCGKCHDQKSFSNPDIRSLKIRE